MPTTSTFCTILHPPYTAWKQAVEECERLKEAYGESGDDAVLAAFEEKKKEAEDARAKYEQVTQEQVEMEDKEGTTHTIIRADALIIADITDRCESPDLRSEAGRVVFVNLDNTSLPEGITFPDGVQELWLEGATMTDAVRGYVREYQKRNPNTMIVGM